MTTLTQRDKLLQVRQWLLEEFCPIVDGIPKWTNQSAKIAFDCIVKILCARE